MPIFDYDPGQSPEAPGTLFFYEQGADPATGFQATSRGAVRSTALSMSTSGTDPAMGRATLVAGTVVVNTSRVTAASNIFLTVQVPAGSVGSPRVSARTAGTSFTITSTQGTDTSTVAWMLVEPSA